MRNWIVLMILLFPWGAYAQQGKIITIEGSAQVEFPDYKSKQQVEKEAEDQAIINALENAFGRVVIESNSTYLTNINSGKKVETNTVFNMIANTRVKGEVINLQDKEYTEIPGIKIIEGRKVPIKDLKCSVTIEAREIIETPPEFEAYTLACVNLNCKTTSFKNNSQFYLYFRSPVPGYLSVFIDDGKRCQRLLPYQGETGMNVDGNPIQTDKEYFFFQKGQNSASGNMDHVDEYSLVADNIQDQNRIFLVFSPTPIPKPVLKDGIGIEQLSEIEKQGGWKVPKALSSEDFQWWLINNRIHNRNITVKLIDITITK
jgi:hypothetical protein